MSSFAVVGVSAGGCYAAACAALIPGRLSGVAIVSCGALAEYNWAERPGTEKEWSPEERAQFELAQHDPEAAARLAAEQAADRFDQLVEHPDLIHEELEAAEGDRWFFENNANTAIFDAHIREAYRQGVDAFKWELIDVLQPWGFRLADIPIPVSIWHGAQDPRVEQQQIDFQASIISKSSVVIWPDSGHMGYVKHWGDMLEALV